MRVQTRHLHVTSVYRIIDHIFRVESGPIRLPELSLVAGLSRFHLTRVFQALTGEALAEFVRRVRLERAALRLKEGSDTIVSMASAAGYANGEAFTRAFRCQYGIAPSEYRRSGSVDWRIPVASGLHWSEGTVRFRPLGLDLRGPEVEIMGRPAMTLAALRHIGPYRETRGLWSDVRRRVCSHAALDQVGRLYTVFHDNHMVVPASKLRADLALEWPEGEEMPEGFRSITIPAGVYVVTRDEVVPDDYQAAWTDLNEQWVPRRGQRPVNTPCLNEFEAWPIPWEASRARLIVGLEMDLGRP